MEGEKQRKTQKDSLGKYFNFPTPNIFNILQKIFKLFSIKISKNLIFHQLIHLRLFHLFFRHSVNDKMELAQTSLYNRSCEDWESQTDEVPALE